MSPRAVAWDIDGTLVDSEARHHRALLAASRAINVDLSDLPDQAFRGVHMLDVWNILRSRYPAKLELESWLSAINAEYVQDGEPMAVMPGAVETIRSLAEAGVPQVCVSNSSRSIVAANVEALGIGEYLIGLVTLDDVSAGKPAPEPYLAACRLLGLRPEQVLAIEDSDTGLRSAKAAGLQVLHFDPTADLGGGSANVIQRLSAVVSRLLHSSDHGPAEMPHAGDRELARAIRPLRRP